MKASVRAQKSANNSANALVDPPKKLTAMEMLAQSQFVEEQKAAAVVAACSSPRSASWTKPILTPPTDSRFIVGEEACLSVKLITANKLRSKDGKSEPFVRLRHADFVWNSKATASSDAPEFHEAIAFPVVRPTVNLLLLEVFERDKFGSKQLLGYVAFDLSLLPKDTPVTTTEQLSGSDSGEITVTLKAVDFGLENIGENYLTHYLSWRKIIPPVDRKPSKHNKARRASSSDLPPSTSSSTSAAAVAGAVGVTGGAAGFCKRGGTIPTFADDSKILASSTPVFSKMGMPKGLALGRRQSAAPALSASASLEKKQEEKKEKQVKKEKGKNKSPGPYGGRSVPSGAYSIENGYVKKNPSPFAKVFGKLQRLSLFKKK